MFYIGGASLFSGLGSAVVLLRLLLSQLLADIGGIDPLQQQGVGQGQGTAGRKKTARKKLMHTNTVPYSSRASAAVEGRWAMASLAQLDSRPPTPNSNRERVGKSQHSTPRGSRRTRSRP